MKARAEVGTAAECLLAAFGSTDEHPDESDYVRSFTGAVLLAEAISDLRSVCKALASMK